MGRERTVLSRMTDLTEDDFASLNALSQLVYPPEEWSDWPGRHVEWADAQWGVRTLAADGTLLSYTGMVMRDGVVDGRAVRIGGVGGIKTHPAWRGQGFAQAGVKYALDLMQELDVQFALLVCEPELLDYYARLGWQEFAGKLLVRQRGAVAEFTFNRVMTHPVQAAAPRTGTIDLCGPPW